MRAALLILALTSSVICISPLLAQRPGVELQAGMGYARAFDGGGFSFAAAVERPLSSDTNSLQHALGGSLWYSNLSIASNPDGPDGRRLLGVGMRYQLELRSCCGPARPFLAVPLQLLYSNIPDRADLADLLVFGIPDVGPPTPAEDRVGAEWGWGTGVELGLRLGLSAQLSAQTSVQGLYHRIYEAGTRNGAWALHGGLSYQLGH